MELKKKSRLLKNIEVPWHFYHNLTEDLTNQEINWGKKFKNVGKKHEFPYLIFNQH